MGVFIDCIVDFLASFFSSALASRFASLFVNVFAVLVYIDLIVLLLEVIDPAPFFFFFLIFVRVGRITVAVSLSLRNLVCLRFGYCLA